MRPCPCGGSQWLGVRGALIGGGKESFTVPDVFQRSSYRMFYSGNRCGYRARAAGERDIRLCRLYTRNDYVPRFNLVVANDKETRTKPPSLPIRSKSLG